MIIHTDIQPKHPSHLRIGVETPKLNPRDCLLIHAHHSVASAPADTDHLK